eukprot:257905_1
MQTFQPIMRMRRALYKCKLKARKSITLYLIGIAALTLFLSISLLYWLYRSPSAENVETRYNHHNFHTHTENVHPRVLISDILTDNVYPQYNHYNLTDLHNYCNDNRNTQQCIHHIIQLQETEPKLSSEFIDSPNKKCLLKNKFLFHAYWVGDIHNNALELFITSFLVTQNHCTKLIIWTNDNKLSYNTNDIIQLFSDLKLNTNSLLYRIEVKTFSNKLFDPSISAMYHGVVGYSDFVRFVVLAKFGGIYLDVDTVFLRDYYPLWNQQFAYPWSDSRINTAVLSLQQNSDTANRFINFISGPKSNGQYPNAHPLSIAGFVQTQTSMDFDILPVILFDAYWLYHDGHTDQTDWWLPRGGFKWMTQPVDTCEKDFNSLFTIFPASFSYHTHAKGTKEVNKDTHFYTYLKQFQKELQMKK